VGVANDGRQDIPSRPPLAPPRGTPGGMSYLALLRRIPSQQRGRDKVARILDAAEELLIEQGYEYAVSTPVVMIERAKVSGGSFYTYFSGPEMVIQSLALRFMEEVKTAADAISREVHADWATAANRFFDTFVDFYQQPAVRELWLGGRLSRTARQADDDCNAHLGRRLEEMLACAALPIPSFRPIRYRVAIEIYDYIMRLAFRAEGQARTDLLGEARHAFLTYLASPERDSPLAASD
jgi:AcrR family transcriptional regulator